VSGRCSSRGLGAVVLDEVDRLGGRRRRPRPRACPASKTIPGRQCVPALAQPRRHASQRRGARLGAGIPPGGERAAAAATARSISPAPAAVTRPTNLAGARRVDGDQALGRLHRLAVDHQGVVAAQPWAHRRQRGGEVVAHGRAGEVGVRLVLEIVSDPGRRRDGDTLRIRQQRLGRFVLGEAAPQERLVGRVLEQPAHEVCHARDQLAERHVDAHALAALGQRAHERLGHAVERLQFQGACGRPRASRAARAWAIDRMLWLPTANRWPPRARGTGA